MALLPGTIKFFAPDKGYGFVLPDDGSGDVFFHHSILSNAPGSSSLDSACPLFCPDANGGAPVPLLPTPLGWRDVLVEAPHRS